MIKYIESLGLKVECVNNHIKIHDPKKIFKGMIYTIPAKGRPRCGVAHYSVLRKCWIFSIRYTKHNHVTISCTTDDGYFTYFINHDTEEVTELDGLYQAVTRIGPRQWREVIFLSKLRILYPDSTFDDVERLQLTSDKPKTRIFHTKYCPPSWVAGSNVLSEVGKDRFSRRVQDMNKDINMER